MDRTVSPGKVTPAGGSGSAQPLMGSRMVERPNDVGSTLLATLDGTRRAQLDHGGLIGLDGAPWSLDWWIGADDRWYLPAREPSVRQNRIGAGPVVETALRIPGGDARQVSYGALVDGYEITVVEITNDSPVPVALALALRPFTLAGEGGGSLAITLRGHVVEIGADAASMEPALVLPRPPNESAGTTGGDLLAVLQAGQPLVWDGPGHSTEGPGANAVLLYPVPHRTSVRFVVVNQWAGDPSAPRSTAAPGPGRTPDAEATARGWTAIVDNGTRLVFPDSGLTEMARAAQARLLLAAPDLEARVEGLEPGGGALLHGLAVAGRRREIVASVEALARMFPTRLGHGPLAAAEVVGGAASALVTMGQRPTTELLETAAQITYLVDRQNDVEASTTAQRGLARLARINADHAGADHLERSLTPEPTVATTELTAMAERASAAGSWPMAGPEGDDPVAAARFLALARSVMIDDTGAELVLLPGFPTAWRGGNVEVHELATRHGLVSFGVRWHGPRPALLWHLDSGSGSVSIRCPALDPEWVATEARGETLLAGTAEALPDVPAPGQSFT